MAVTKHSFTCTRGGLTIRGFSFLPEGTGLPAIIISHGFGGSAADEFAYAQQLAEKGWAAFTFDFCGGSPRSTSDGAFRDMTVLTEKEDLKAVMDYVCAQPCVDGSHLTLMGCSQGGFVSALAAAEWPERVEKLVLFYPALCIPEDSRRGNMLMYSFDPENVPELVGGVDAQGNPIDVEPLGRGYVTCMQRVDAFSTISAYPGPVLIVHGDKDGAVNVRNSRRAQAAYNAIVPRRCQLAEIAGADHGYKGQEDVDAMEMVERFLEGGTLVLAVDVVCTGCTREQQGEETVSTIPFGATVSTPFFSGMVQPGAKDVQRWKGDQIVRLCADYVLTGTDYTGTPCSVHIINEDLGHGWRPTITTDSKALVFLNTAELSEAIESRQCGPMVRIFAKGVF